MLDRRVQERKGLYAFFFCPQETGRQRIPGIERQQQLVQVIAPRAVEIGEGLLVERGQQSVGLGGGVSVVWV